MAGCRDMNQEDTFSICWCGIIAQSVSVSLRHEPDIFCPKLLAFRSDFKVQQRLKFNGKLRATGYIFPNMNEYNPIVSFSTPDLWISVQYVIHSTTSSFIIVTSSIFRLSSIFQRQLSTNTINLFALFISINSPLITSSQKERKNN